MILAAKCVFIQSCALLHLCQSSVKVQIPSQELGQKQPVHQLKTKTLLLPDPASSSALAQAVVLSYLRFFASRLLGDFGATIKSDGL